VFCALLIPLASGIKCYNCFKQNADKCKDNYVDCGPRIGYCFRMTVKTEKQGSVVYAQCGFTDSVPDQCQEGTACTCSTNLCNGNNLSKGPVHDTWMTANSSKQQANNIECYNCISTNGIPCKGTTCTGNQCLQGSVKIQGLDLVYEQCGIPQTAYLTDQCAKATVCACGRDGCNGGTIPVASLLQTAVVAIFLAVTYI